MMVPEILFIIALLIPLIPMAIARQWWMFGVFFVFYISFGIVEWQAVVHTGQTVSQHFWIYSQENSTMAIIILITMALMWIGLLWHLSIKLINKKEKK